MEDLEREKFLYGLNLEVYNFWVILSELVK